MRSMPATSWPAEATSACAANASAISRKSPAACTSGDRRFARARAGAWRGFARNSTTTTIAMNPSAMNFQNARLPSDIFPMTRSIGFFARGKLKTVEASGGPVQVIADAPTARGGTWGKNGIIVFTPDFRGGLYRVPASGGATAPLTKVELSRHTTHRWPSYLPDGKHVLYLAANHANPRSDQSGIYVASLDGGEPRRVMPSYGSAQYVPGYLLSVRDSNLMAAPFDPDRLSVTGGSVRVAGNVNFDYGTWRGVFTASENGVLAYQVARDAAGGQVTWIDTSGRALSTVGERSEAYALRLSPDNRRASLILGDPNNDIWIYELERGVRTRLTTDAQVIMSPVWSRDSSQILFVTGESLQKADVDYVMATLPADGAGERRDQRMGDDHFVLGETAGRRWRRAAPAEGAGAGAAACAAPRHAR